jgi:2-methylcitrate dehydratase
MVNVREWEFKANLPTPAPITNTAKANLRAMTTAAHTLGLELHVFNASTERQPGAVLSEETTGCIDKKGPLANPADRDHCVQYMVAVPLLFGRLTAADYEDDVAGDPRIDSLRERIACIEDPQFTQDYHDPSQKDAG